MICQLGDQNRVTAVFTGWFESTASTVGGDVEWGGVGITSRVLHVFQLPLLIMLEG